MNIAICHFEFQTTKKSTLAKRKRFGPCLQHRDYSIFHILGHLDNQSILKDHPLKV